MNINENKAFPDTIPQYRQRPGLSLEDAEQIKRTFELLDYKQIGRVQIPELKESLESLGIHKQKPSLYQIACELDTAENRQLGGCDLDQFLRSVNKRLKADLDGDEKSEIFRLLSDKGNDITVRSLVGQAASLGDDISEDCFRDLIERLSANGYSISKEDFDRILG